MHNVNQSWVDNQEKQLRKETLLRLSVFNQQVVPLYSEVDDSGLHANQITCLELMAVRELDGRSSAEFTIKRANLNFDNFHWKATSTFRISCYSNGSLVYEELSDDVSGTVNDVELIIFSPEFEEDVIDIYYACFGSLIELENKDIQELNYKAHCSVINEDLPYHKVSFKTIQKSFPLDYTVVMYAEVGYKGIQYIPLGCGYYYLDRNSYANDGFVQQYNFIDILSTLTQKFVLNNANNGTYKSFVEMLLSNKNSYVKMPFVPNFDNSNLSTSFAMNGYRSSVYEKTIAQTLQMVAQANGLALYVDEKNIIKFTKPQLSAVPYVADTNDMWLLESPATTSDERARRLTINAMKTEIEKEDNVNPIQLASFVSVSGQQEYVAEINGIYTGLALSSGSFVYSSQNYLVIRQNSAGVTTNITAMVQWGEPQVKNSMVYDIDLDGTAEYTLNLELGYDPNFTAVSEHYTYWLARNRSQTLQVRYDSKYFLLDKIESALKEYSDFIIEDLSATYGNGCKGTIKGRVMQTRLLPPTIQNVENGGITIVNPNADDVELVMVLNDTEVSQYGYSFKANETKTIWDNDLQTAYNEWVDNGYGRKTDFFVYFEDGSGQELLYLDSKNAIVFGGK